MTRLPRSTDELAGMRAARWIRESTSGQFDRYGPDSQRHEQDRFIERFGLVDTGLVYTVAQSGRTVWRSPAMADMLAAAGRDFDVILMGYFDRWQRNTRRTIEIVEDRLHPAGAAWVMCDRRLLSSDPRDWREMRKLASEAEEYSEKLGERITDGYAAKFRRFADQAGNAPVGFRRSPTDHVLEVDPVAIVRIVELFGAYAAGNRSIEELAGEFALGTEQVRKALANPLYNGWVRRHRGHDEHRAPATWRANPPVGDELWARVQELRRVRARGQLTRRTIRTPDLLGGLLFCAGCGQPLTSDGLKGEGRRRRLHRYPCEAWGPHARRTAATYEAPISAQLAGIRLTQGSLARLAAALTAPPRDDLTRARLEREKRSLALDVAAGRMSDETYLARIATLRAQVEAIERQPADAGIADPSTAMAYARNLAAAWDAADEAARVELAHAVYARIEVVGDEFRRLELTPEAYHHGLQAVLPRSVEVAMAPPAGARAALTTVRLPVDDRRGCAVRVVNRAV